MEQVAIFSAGDPREIEKRINEWLQQDLEIMKVTRVVPFIPDARGRHYFTVMIFYDWGGIRKPTT